MKKLKNILHGIIFLVVGIPVMFFAYLSDEKARKKAKKTENESN